MKKHSIENSAFRMTLVINPCHGSRDNSRNGPGWSRGASKTNIPLEATR